MVVLQVPSELHCPQHSTESHSVSNTSAEHGISWKHTGGTRGNLSCSFGTLMSCSTAVMSFKLNAHGCHLVSWFALTTLCLLSCLPGMGEGDVKIYFKLLTRRSCPTIHTGWAARAGGMWGDRMKMLRMGWVGWLALWGCMMLAFADSWSHEDDVAVRTGWMEWGGEWRGGGGRAVKQTIKFGNIWREKSMCFRFSINASYWFKKQEGRAHLIGWHRFIFVVMKPQAELHGALQPST